MSRRTLLIVYSSKQFIGSLKSYKDFVMIVIVAAKVCLNCSFKSHSLSNSENTSPTLLLKDPFKRSSARNVSYQRSLQVVVGGNRAHHLAHLLSGDPASSIPRLPSPPAPTPRDSSQLSL